jgi:hypothetical protein
LGIEEYLSVRHAEVCLALFPRAFEGGCPTRKICGNQLTYTLRIVWKLNR